MARLFFNNKIYYEMNNEKLAKVFVWLRSVDAVFDFLNGFGSVLEVYLNYISDDLADYRLVFFFCWAMLNLNPFLPCVHFDL